jgi:hypothetical protein
MGKFEQKKAPKLDLNKVKEMTHSTKEPLPEDDNSLYSITRGRAITLVSRDAVSSLVSRHLE